VPVAQIQDRHGSQEQATRPGSISAVEPSRKYGAGWTIADGGSRKQAARFQDLLQPPSHAYLTGRANAGSARVTTSRQSPFVSMATPLSSPLSDTFGCLIWQRLALAAVSGRERQNFQEILQCFASQSISRIRSFDCHRMRSCAPTVRARSLSQGDHQQNRTRVTIRQRQGTRVGPWHLWFALLLQCAHPSEVATRGQ
jgi:hypothetical protein